MVAQWIALLVLGLNGPDLSSPQATLKSFMAALSQAKLQDASVCVEGGSYGQAAESLEKKLTDHRVTWEVDVNETTPDGDAVKATCVVHVTFPEAKKASQLNLEEQTVQLCHDQDGWRILPIPEQELSELVKDQVSFTKQGVIELMATAFCHEDMMVGINTGIEKAIVEISALSQMKHLCLLVLLFVSDSDDHFPKQGADLKVLLSAYVKDQDKDSDLLDRFDDHDGVRWVFNPTFLGHQVEDVEDPGNTVMLYEADHDQLGFRYAGRALVALANGATRLVTKEQSLKLYWQPKPARNVAPSPIPVN